MIHARDLKRKKKNKNKKQREDQKRGHKMGAIRMGAYMWVE
jgi:hypothetical protein